MDEFGVYPNVDVITYGRTASVSSGVTVPAIYEREGASSSSTRYTRAVLIRA